MSNKTSNGNRNNSISALNKNPINYIKSNTNKEEICNNALNKNPISKINQKLFPILALSILILLFSSIAFAVPNSLTLQGKLTNKAGASQQGTYNFVFRIYSNSTFGYYNVTQDTNLANGSTVPANITYINYTNILWQQNQSITTDVNGIYDVILNNISLSFADQYYLGIIIGDDNESVPRINLTSAPYSFRANVSEGLNANNSYFVTNLSVTGNATIGTGITTLEISTQGFNLSAIGNIKLAFNLSVAGATFFVDGTNNFVGIGMTNPNYLLQVGNGTDGRSVNLSNVFYVNGSSGKVGINTENPKQTLVVNGGVNITGGLNVTGDTNISGNFYVTGNTILGSSVQNTLEVVSGVASDLVPIDNSRSLGSAANFWRRAYIDLATISNLSVTGNTSIGGTNSPTWTLNSNYSGNDALDIELIFERGTPITNAVFKWDSTNKRFDINFPLFIQANNNLTVDTNTLFVDGSVHRVGIGTTSPNYLLQTASGTDGRSVNLSNVLYVNASNQSVGILITNPHYPIEIGNANGLAIRPDGRAYQFLVDDSAGSFKLKRSDSTGFLSVVPDSTQVKIGTDSGSSGTLAVSAGASLYLNTGEGGSGGNVVFGKRLSDDLVLATTYAFYGGSVGIGRTPSSTLHVNGSGASGGFRVTNESGTEIFFVNSTSGNIGIGTTTPGKLLTIQSSTSTDNIRFNASSNLQQGIEFTDNSTGAIAHVQLIGTTQGVAGRDGYLELAGKSGIAFRDEDVGERMRIVGGTGSTGGYVGIGTTAPYNTLTVAGSISANSINATSINATDRLIVNNTLFVNGSFVGIGTSSPSDNLYVLSTTNGITTVRSTSATTGNRAALGIQHITSGDMTDGFGTIATFGIQDNAGVMNTIASLGAQRDGADNSGAIVFNTVTNGASALERLRISTSGNVGIGTTAPFSLLHLNKSDDFNKSVTNVLTLDHTNPNGVNLTGGIGVSILFRANDNASQLEDIANISAILVNSTNGTEYGAIAFATRGADKGDGASHLTEVMRITNGSVGIGTTTPLFSLVVSKDQDGAFGNGANIVVDNPDAGANGGASALRIMRTGASKWAWVNDVNSDATDDLTLWGQGAIKPIVVKATSGNVGINTTTPAQTLQVAGTLNVTSQPTRSGDLFVASSGNVGIGTTSPQNALDVVGAVTVSRGLNASNLNVTGFSITDDSLVTLADGSKKKIKDVKAGEEVLTLEEKTGKLVPRKVNALLDHGIKPIYEMATEDGRSINTTAEHPYFVKSSLLGIGDNSNLPSSFNSIKNPSKSSGLGLSLSKTAKDSNKASGLCCGALSHTTENILSLGNFEESVKCQSLMTNTLCSDLENSANTPFESPFGLNAASKPCCLRNLNNSFLTFSSSRNFGFLFNSNDDIITPSGYDACIMQSSLDVLFGERSNEIIHNLFDRDSCFKQLENLPNHDSCAFKGRCSAADFAVRNDVLVDFNSHAGNDNNPVFKLYDAPYKLGEWTEVRYLKAGDEIAVPDYSTGAITWKKISSIKQLPPQHVYDLSIEGTRNFIANDIVAHNTYLATSSGNVGINTTTPAQTLQVAGTLNVTSQPTRSGDLFVASSGNVGIGTTQPASLLHLSSATAEIRLNDTDNPNWWQVGAVGDDFKIALNDSTTDVFYIDEDGEVGIGTTGPVSTLELRGANKVLGTDEHGIAVIRSTDSFAINKGGSLSFGGKYNTAGDMATFGSIWGLKDTSADGAFTGYLAFATSPGGTPTEKMRITQGGNVGIGTTTPNSKLQIQGTGQLVNVNGSDDTSAVYARFGSSASTSQAFIGVDSSAGGAIATGSTARAFVVSGSASGNDLQLATAGNVRMTVDENGNVGIGTTSPTISGQTKEVDIVSSAAASSVGLVLSGNQTADGFLGVLDFTNGNTRVATISGNRIDADNSAELRFYTNNAGGGLTQQMVISKTGNVGIGTTSPLSKLHVSAGNLTLSQTASTVGETPAINFITATGSTPARRAFIQADAVTLGDLKLQAEGSQAISLNPDGGNVGIGTTSPGVDLDVNKTEAGATTDIRVFNNDNTNGASHARLLSYVAGASSGDPKIGLGILAVRDYFWYIDNSDSDKLKLSTNDVDKLTIDTSGNVGIGTTGPQKQFNINGTGDVQLRISDTGTSVGLDLGYDDAGTTNAYILNRYNSNSASAIKFGFATPADNDIKMTILQSGNIGIGTTSPDAILDIIGAAAQSGSDIDPIVDIDDSVTACSGCTLIGQRIVVNDTPGASSTNIGLWINVSRGTAGSYAAIFESGNIGINTTTPDQTLEIVGNVCLDDNAGTACSARTIPIGAMEADGTITSNAFDLAERYYASEEMEAGDVVVVQEVKYEEYLAASVLDIKEPELRKIMNSMKAKDPEELSEKLEDIANAIAGSIQPSQITGNAVNDVQLETDLSSILEPESADAQSTETSEVSGGLNAASQAQQESTLPESDSNENESNVNATVEDDAEIDDNNELTLEMESKLKEKIIKRLKEKDFYIGDSTGKDKLLSSKVAIVSLTTIPNDAKIVGVISSDPAFVMGSYSDLKAEKNVPVALVGRTPVKVSLENGPIKAGDPLTSAAKKGYAAKSISSGKIIGYALEGYSKETKNSKILVMMNPGWYTAPSEATGGGKKEQAQSQQPAQLDFMQKVNGSVIIRLG